MAYPFERTNISVKYYISLELESLVILWTFSTSPLGSYIDNISINLRNGMFSSWIRVNLPLNWFSGQWLILWHCFYNIWCIRCWLYCIMHCCALQEIWMRTWKCSKDKLFMNIYYLESIYDTHILITFHKMNHVSGFFLKLFASSHNLH